MAKTMAYGVVNAHKQPRLLLVGLNSGPLLEGRQANDTVAAYRVATATAVAGMVRLDNAPVAVCITKG